MKKLIISLAAAFLAACSDGDSGTSPEYAEPARDTLYVVVVDTSKATPAESNDTSKATPAESKDTSKVTPKDTAKVSPETPKDTTKESPKDTTKDTPEVPKDTAPTVKYCDYLVRTTCSADGWKGKYAISKYAIKYMNTGVKGFSFADFDTRMSSTVDTVERVHDIPPLDTSAYIPSNPADTTVFTAFFSDSSTVVGLVDKAYRLAAEDPLNEGTFPQEDSLPALKAADVDGILRLARDGIPAFSCSRKVQEQVCEEIPIE